MSNYDGNKEIEELMKKIDWDKVWQETERLPVNEKGEIVLDPNNPKHREWMED